MKRLRNIFLLIITANFFYISNATDTMHPVVDVVIFSYNRPLQLYALLESLHTYCTGIGIIQVIYRVDTEQFRYAYDAVFYDFNRVKYYRQGKNPYQDFKKLTLQSLRKSLSPYIMFAVDDIIVKDFIDLRKCVDALEKWGAYGFYFRLGINLTHCYSWLHAKQPLPPLQQVEPDILSWCFKEGTFDWQYPHTVDMTIYRKNDVLNHLRGLSYHAPNKLEDVWNILSKSVLNKRGLCYRISKIVNIPLNRVQHEYKNPVMDGWSPEMLLQEFVAGKKIDITALYNIYNTEAHMEYCPTFVNR